MNDFVGNSSDSPTFLEAIAKMRSPYQMGIICIDITNKCDLDCSNCTRLLVNQDKYWEMTPENFRMAARSLAEYPGVIAVIGGNPPMHRHFPDLCRIFAEEFPDKKRRGLWSNNIFKHTNIIKETFGFFNLNPHGVQRGIDSVRPLVQLKNSSPDITVQYHEGNSTHSPLLAAVSDLLDEDAMWNAVGECDVNQQWSAAIVQNKGNLRAYFCEVAASFDLARGTDNGIEVTPGWWRRTIRSDADFQHQVRTFCPGCGVPARLKGSLDADETDTYTLRNADLAQKAAAKGRKLVEVRRKTASFNSTDRKVTDYAAVFDGKPTACDEEKGTARSLAGTERAMKNKIGLDHVMNDEIDLWALCDEAFVRAVYRMLLGREADESGLNHYLNFLRNGSRRVDILYSIANSDEARNRNANIPPSIKEIILLRRSRAGRRFFGLSAFRNFMKGVVEMKVDMLEMRLTLRSIANLLESNEVLASDLAALKNRIAGTDREGAAYRESSGR